MGLVITQCLINNFQFICKAIFTWLVAIKEIFLSLQRSFIVMTTNTM